MADPQFCFLAIDHWSTCMTKAEWSGWWQAIGSVCAIAAGFVGLSYQADQQRKAARTQKIREELEVVSEYRDLLEEALAVVVATKNHAGTQDSYMKYLLDDTGTTRFAKTAELVGAVNSLAMPTAALKVSFSIAQEAMRTAVELRFSAEEWATGSVERDFEKWNDTLQYTAVISALIEVVNAFDAHLLELRKFAGLVQFDQVDDWKFLSRAERARLKKQA